MKILYVEDNPANVALIQRVATLERHEVLCYERAEDALDNYDVDRPDLALVDLRLAGQIDGVDFIRTLREAQEELPIVVLTAYDYKELREAAWDAGCNAYFVKPLQVQQVQDIIQEYNL
jgi:two-component system, cell cycle response regulator DivK